MKPTPNGYASGARDEARRILSGTRYHSKPAKTFRPFAGVLGAVGRFFERVFGPAGRWLERELFRPTGSWFSATFGRWWPVVVIAIVVASGAFLGALVIRRRTRSAAETERGAAADEHVGWPELERLAEDAERSGDLEQAIRLRFRAGLVRLERDDGLVGATSRTNAELSRDIGSPTFDGLASDLEAIVYGGSEATAEQAGSSRDGWPVVYRDARRKVGIR